MRPLTIDAFYALLQSKTFFKLNYSCDEKAKCEDVINTFASDENNDINLRFLAKSVIDSPGFIT